MADLTIDIIKKYFADNENDDAVKAYLSDLRSGWIKTDDGKNFLFTDEGKVLYQSEIDRAVSKAIDTYKEKTLPGLIKDGVTEKIKETNPKETPEQKQIREQNERINNLENRDKLNLLKDYVYKKLTADKLSEFNPVADWFTGDDEETTKGRIVQFKSILDAYVSAKIKEAFPSREVEGSNPLDPKAPGFKNPFSQKYLNYTEQGRIVREDPKLAEKLKAEVEKES